MQIKLPYCCYKIFCFPQASLVFSLGQKSFEASSKYTTKESRASVTYCSKPGTCSVVGVHSIIKSVGKFHLVIFISLTISTIGGYLVTGNNFYSDMNTLLVPQTK
jgi:hypothetical protein